MGFLGLIGFGGGATSLAVGGAPTAFEATGGVKYGPAPNNKIYHIFENSTPGPTSNFVVSGVGPYTMEVFMIGGGGAGGDQHGGGGGAGALFYQPDFPMPKGTFTVSVGAGGAADKTQTTGGSGGNTSLGTLVVCNGGGGGGSMGVDGANGGCGGGGGMRPVNPGPHPNRQPGGEGTGVPTHPGSPYVHAYDGGTGSDYSAPQAGSGGIGGGGGGAGGVGSSTPDDTPNRGPWPAPTSPVASSMVRGQGGNDWSAPDALFPSDVRTGMGAAMGTPTLWLGCAYPMPTTAIMMFAGGGAGASHTPWGIFNETGWNAPNPVNPGDWGGGSGIPTLSGWGMGGIGGEGNNDIGRNGSNFRGGGGGGSGDAAEEAGRGGSGICIIVYPDSTS